MDLQKPIPVSTSMTEKLLPPADSPTAFVQISPGKTSGYFAPRTSTRHYAQTTNACRHSCRESQAESKCSEWFKIALWVTLLLAICAGFMVLYCRMTQLQRELEFLQELGKQTEAQIFYSDYQFPNQDDHTEGNIDQQTDSKVQLRGRRSVADGAGHRIEKRTVQRSSSSGQAGHITNQLSSHLVPTSAGIRYYQASEFFEWTQAAQNAHSQFSIDDRKFIVAPFTGYYFIYSQMTLELMSASSSENKRPRGHGLWVKTRCGQSDPRELAHTYTTQTFTPPGLEPKDSTYLAGVYYLEQFDHVGIRLMATGQLNGATFRRTEKNCYFGAILLQRQAELPGGCTYYG